MEICSFKTNLLIIHLPLLVKLFATGILLFIITKSSLPLYEQIFSNFNIAITITILGITDRIVELIAYGRQGAIAVYWKTYNLLFTLPKGEKKALDFYYSAPIVADYLSYFHIKENQERTKIVPTILTISLILENITRKHKTITTKQFDQIMTNFLMFLTEIQTASPSSLTNKIVELTNDIIDSETGNLVEKTLEQTWTDYEQRVNNTSSADY